MLHRHLLTALRLWISVALTSFCASAEAVNWKYRDLSVPYGSSLTIQVPAVAERQHVIGVKAVSSAGAQNSARVMIGEVQFQDRSAAHKIVSSIDNLAPEFARIGNGLISVRSSGPNLKALALLAHVAVGTRVSIVSGDAEAISGVVGPDGLLVSDGISIGRPVLGMQSVLMQLVQGAVPAKNDGTPKPLPNGRYFVSLEGLRQNLETYVAPPTVIAGLASCCDRVIRLKLLIDQRGQVKSAESGDGVVASDLVNVALRWRFRPFQVKGSPVDVEGIVPVRTDRSGAVQQVGVR